MLEQFPQPVVAGPADSPRRSSGRQYIRISQCCELSIEQLSETIITRPADVPARTIL